MEIPGASAGWKSPSAPSRVQAASIGEIRLLRPEVRPNRDLGHGNPRQYPLDQGRGHRPEGLSQPGRSRRALQRAAEQQDDA